MEFVLYLCSVMSNTILISEKDADTFNTKLEAKTQEGYEVMPETFKVNFIDHPRKDYSGGYEKTVYSVLLKKRF